MPERFLHCPNLPQSRVSMVLLSPEYPAVFQSVQKLGIQAIATISSQNLPDPIRYHSDMLCCYLGDGLAVVPHGEEKLIQRLNYFDIQTIVTQTPLGKCYPEDAPCNILQIAEKVFWNPKSAAPEIQQQLAEKQHFAVAQGYTRCAAAVVDANSLITADRGVSRTAQKAGVEVLEIQPGHIQLPGYEYGFIGGCCGLAAPDELLFTGSLKSHPDGRRIQEFLQQRNITAIELTDGPLLDIGGILPIREIAHDTR